MSGKAIEAAARAVMLARPNGGCIVQDWQREAQDNPHVETAMKQAQAAVQAYLAAMEAEGFVMVPVEPTSKQLGEGHGVLHHQCPLVTYSAMLAARPQPKD